MRDGDADKFSYAELCDAAMVVRCNVMWWCCNAFEMQCSGSFDGNGGCIGPVLASRNHNVIVLGEAECNGVGSGG